MGTGEMFSCDTMSETGTSTCFLSRQLLVHDFPPLLITFDQKKSTILAVNFLFILYERWPQPSRVLHISNAQHSYCEFGTLFLFSCPFVCLKLPVASEKGRQTKASFHSLVKSRRSSRRKRFLFKWAQDSHQNHSHSLHADGLRVIAEVFEIAHFETL